MNIHLQERVFVAFAAAGLITFAVATLAFVVFLCLYATDVLRTNSRRVEGWLREDTGAAHHATRVVALADIDPAAVDYDAELHNLTKGEEA